MLENTLENNIYSNLGQGGSTTDHIFICNFFQVNYQILVFEDFKQNFSGNFWCKIVEIAKNWSKNCGNNFGQGAMATILSKHMQNIKISFYEQK